MAGIGFMPPRCSGAGVDVITRRAGVASRPPARRSRSRQCWRRRRHRTQPDVSPWRHEGTGEQSSGDGFKEAWFMIKSTSYPDYSCYIASIACIATSQSSIPVHDPPNSRPADTSSTCTVTQRVVCWQIAGKLPP